MASAAPSSLPAALAKPRKRKRPATTAATSSKQQATEQDSGFGSRPERTAAAERFYGKAEAAKYWSLDCHWTVTGLSLVHWTVTGHPRHRQPAS